MPTRAERQLRRWRRSPPAGWSRLLDAGGAPCDASYRNQACHARMTIPPLGATADRANAFDVMLLISYALRDDAEARGYDDWLRRVDNPFFNAAPGIAHYGNWKVTGGTNHFAPNTHFDFVGMDGPESFDQVWNDPELNRFRQEWRRLWGIADANPAAKIETCLCERITSPAMAWSDRLALLPGQDEAPTGWETWRVLRSLRGSGLGFNRFHLRYGAGPDASGGASERHHGAALATCIAAPNLTSSTRTQAQPAQTSTGRT